MTATFRPEDLRVRVGPRPAWLALADLADAPDRACLESLDARSLSVLADSTLLDLAERHIPNEHADSPFHADGSRPTLHHVWAFTRPSGKGRTRTFTLALEAQRLDGDLLWRRLACVMAEHTRTGRPYGTDITLARHETIGAVIAELNAKAKDAAPELSRLSRLTFCGHLLDRVRGDQQTAAAQATAP